jgi:hypothetical protein
MSEYLNFKQTVDILKSQIESKRREVHTLTLSNGANSYLTLKTEEFLLDCIASISKTYGMYKQVNQARYNERNILETPSSIASPYKKPGFISWYEFSCKSPRDLLKMLEKYPIILKILKQSVSNVELLRKDDVPYNTSISPQDNVLNLESLNWELPDISL